MRVLITGGGGFIGSHILKQLLEKNIETVSLDISPLNNALVEVLTHDEQQQITCITGDICDFPALCRIIVEHQITHVIHLASMLIDAASANPYRAAQIMNGGMINILEAARIFHLKKVVWASSMSVFSSQHEGFLENDALHDPDSVYGACKSWGERMAAHYHKEWNVNSVGLRFGVVYGFGRLRGPSRFATDLIRMPALNQPFDFDFGESQVDWQYIGDIAKITIKALFAETLPQRFYTVKGDQRSLRDAAGIVRKYLPDAKINLGNQSMKVVPTGNDAALWNDLGVRADTSLETGIRETIAAYHVQKDSIGASDTN